VQLTAVGGFFRLRLGRRLAMVDLRLQEDDGELHSGVLDLLLTFSCGEQWWTMA
jgi:hypothetical protein